MDHVFPSSISLREQDQSPCHPCLSRMSKHTASIDVNTLLVARVVQAFLGFQVYREFLVSPSGLAVLEHNPIEKQQQQQHQNKHFAKAGHKQQRGKKLRKLTRIGSVEWNWKRHWNINFEVISVLKRAGIRRGSRINTDRFPKRTPKAWAFSGLRGLAPPRLNYLDFYSLKSPFLGFRVIQMGYWPDFNLESVFIFKNIKF